MRVQTFTTEDFRIFKVGDRAVTGTDDLQLMATIEAIETRRRANGLYEAIALVVGEVNNRFVVGLGFSHPDFPPAA